MHDIAHIIATKNREHDQEKREVRQMELEAEAKAQRDKAKNG